MYRDLFIFLTNSYNEALLKSFNIDVWRGSKYASVIIMKKAVVVIFQNQVLFWKNYDRCATIQNHKPDLFGKYLTGKTLLESLLRLILFYKNKLRTNNEVEIGKKNRNKLRTFWGWEVQK